jgi:hypothetical protein
VAAGVARLLRAGLEILLTDPSLAAVLSGPGPECAQTTELSQELFASLTTLLGRAHAEGAIRPDVTADDLRRLMCGLQHAVQIGGDDSAGRYLEIMLHGLRA